MKKDFNSLENVMCDQGIKDRIFVMLSFTTNIDQRCSMQVHYNHALVLYRKINYEMSMVQQINQKFNTYLIER